MVNVALVLPPGTVILAGTLTDDELTLSETTIPPLGEALLNVTVPWELLPPVTLVGLREIELNVGGFTVSVVVLVTPL